MKIVRIIINHLEIHEKQNKRNIYETREIQNTKDLPRKEDYSLNKRGEKKYRNNYRTNRPELSYSRYSYSGTLNFILYNT